ncbi:MAG: potassium transporter TrkG [Bacteroidota bacterium]
MRLNVSAVVGVLGALLGALGVALLAPMGVALYYGEAEWWGFGVTALVAGGGGAGLWFTNRPQREIQIRDGFAIVALAWIVMALVGAVPFVLTGVLDSYTDAFFETISGFTTTGATILGGADTPAIEAIPNAFLFWRSLMHWLGGMGIIVLTLAVMPLLGIGGMQLFKAEVPGPTADKLTPRVRDTATRLWGIYAGLTLVNALLLLPEMSVFDAVNHAFSTMATGGFSTENGSLGQYGSAYVEWVTVLFMFIGGANFTLHYYALRGKPGVFWQSGEFRTYLGICLTATVLITLALWAPTNAVLPANTGDLTEPGLTLASLLDALRIAAFQVVAVITTTGLGTSDYELWPALGLGVLFLLFFVGGMAGSTSGGFKVLRHILLFKNAQREVHRLLHPQAIFPIRLDHRVVPPDVMRNVLSFVVLYLLLLLLGTLLLALTGLDLFSAFAATAASVGNVGPGFGAVGPTESYAVVPAFGKWVLGLLMVAGRLEIFTLIVLLTPDFWQR